MWKFNDFGGKTAIITEDGRQISYAKLLQDGTELCRQISGRCLVFCLCRSEYASVMGYTAFLEGGIIPTLLDAELDRELLWKLIKLYCPDYLWVPEKSADEFCIQDGYDGIYMSECYCLIRTPFSHVYPLHDDLALLLTTSGSTGSPKFVKQTRSNIISNTESIIEYLGIDGNERAITTLPMSYTYGLSIINTHLYVGAVVILTGKGLMQKEFWRQLKEFEATSFGGVPYTYEMLDKLRFFRMELPKLTTMTQAGGKLPPALHKKFAEYAEENDKRLVIMYGATEATARMGYLPADKALEKYGSMGFAIPGGAFSLIDEDGTIIDEPDVAGELVYEGPNVTMGYAQCGEDLIRPDERNGIYHTGDIAKRDEDGFYYITGRKKRFLKMFGSRVNMDEIEQLVKAAFQGLGCACGGVDDKMYLFVTDKDVLDDIKRYIVEKTGINPAAIFVKFLEEIPKNDSGKTLYVALERYYA